MEPPIENEGQSVALQADRDNTLYEDAGGALSNGAGEFFFAGRTAQPLNRRGLVRFDVGSGGLPAGATLDSVKLTLRLNRTNSGAFPMSVHRVTSDWGEGGSVAPGPQGAGGTPDAGDATWVHTFFDTAQWSTPGGDFAATASASVTVGEVAKYTWSSAGLLADVRAWVADPSDNFGWMLIGAEGGGVTAKRFDSRESSTAGNRPVLTIFYRP